MQRVNISGRRMGKTLSAVMTVCVQEMRAWGGLIERYPGGFWAKPGEATHCEPEFGTPTIEALVQRGFAVYSEHKEGARVTLPIKATLTAAAAAVPDVKSIAAAAQVKSTGLGVDRDVHYRFLTQKRRAQ